MKDYESSFNFIIGMGDEEFDWFNNPYIEINVYELTEAYEPKISEDVRLVRC